MRITSTSTLVGVDKVELAATKAAPKSALFTMAGVKSRPQVSLGPP